MKNDSGIFTDVTKQGVSELQRPGMVTSAVWADVDDDNMPDLVINGEWMSIRLFQNNGTRLHEITDQTGSHKRKDFWRSLKACDIIGDDGIQIL